MQLVKRKYIAPDIIEQPIDNEISLIMMTWNPGDGKPPTSPGIVKKTNSGNIIKLNPFNTNPF